MKEVFFGVFLKKRKGGISQPQSNNMHSCLLHLDCIFEKEKPIDYWFSSKKKFMVCILNKNISINSGKINFWGMIQIPHPCSLIICAASHFF